MYKKNANTNYLQKKASITYQNKDVISKLFGEQMLHKSFQAYGYALPKITQVLPTNLPAVEANELRLDNLFRLEDNSLAIIDYESIYKYEDKITYLNYVIRTLKRNSIIGKTHQHIRVIIIYTGNIVPSQTNSKLDIGCLQFSVEEIFLSNLNAAEIEKNLRKKVEGGEAFTEEEQMRFIVLPLIYKRREDKQECIKRCISLAEKILDSRIQTFLLSGLLVFTDKVIQKEDAEHIRRWIQMTQVGRIIQREFNEALQHLEMENKQVQEENKKSHLAIIQTIRNLNSRNISVDEIMSIIPNVSRELVLAAIGGDDTGKKE